MISKNNKHITIKVSNNAYSFLKDFSELYNCSMASLCQHLISTSILNMSNLKDNDPNFYKRLGYYIKNNYDLRRK